MLNPSQKTAVVTGASTGIGFSICETYVQRGYRVFGTVRSSADAERLTKQLGETFFPLMMDVTNAEQIAAAVEIVADSLSGAKLDVLVNNAGIAVVGPMIHLRVEQFRRQLEVNLVGVFQVTQAFLPLLGTDVTRAGRPGRIMNISSVAGKLASPFSSFYAASKHGLEGFSACLRQELLMYGIDVIVIGPGVVDTPIWDKNTAATVDAYAHTEYADVLREMLQITDSYVQKGFKPEAIADVVYHASVSRFPKTRYAVVRNRLLNWTLFRLLPERWVDWAIGKRLGLHKKQ